MDLKFKACLPWAGKKFKVLQLRTYAVTLPRSRAIVSLGF
jgi:hypothetical protein